MSILGSYRNKSKQDKQVEAAKILDAEDMGEPELPLERGKPNVIKAQYVKKTNELLSDIRWLLLVIAIILAAIFLRQVVAGI